MAGRVPVFDDHVHLRPDGHHIEAAKRYEAAGGTHFMLVHSPHDDFAPDGKPDWHRAFDRTVKTAEAVREETGLRCWVMLGPYPVHLVHMIERFGVDKAKDLFLRGAEVATEYVANGKAVGIGEVGRIHFAVDPRVQAVANDLLLQIFQLARQAVCPVMLHTESATPEVMADLARIATQAGMPLDKVVKHYSAPLVLPEEHHGLVPSIIASRKHIRRAAEVCPEGRWFLETDYIDDLTRPGVVMPIETVPKRVEGFLQNGDLDEEVLHRSGVEWVEKVYGVETGF